jgi:hypothetical protein
MTRVHGGALAAIGVVALAIAPITHYAVRHRAAKPRVSTTVDCGRSARQVEVVGRTITNRATKTPGRNCH